MARIGVFVCHCGENIARTVDVKKVAESAKDLPGVVFATDYTYMCSAPGQKLVMEAIKEHNLTGAVISACSPQLHEPTFRSATQCAGLNRFRCEMANIREQCSWVHNDRVVATEKASSIMASMVAKVGLANDLQPTEIPITKRALVIGGGVAGVRAALDIANSGYQVVLVEKQPSIGGNMARLSETFPTLDCSQCILTPLMVEVSRHKNIELITNAEVQEVGGYVGNFKVKIRQKGSFVHADKCTACNLCSDVCPVSVPNDFDRGLSWRKAIYIPFPQAVPSTYTLDADHCVNKGLTGKGGYKVIACERCAQACGPGAIDFDFGAKNYEREVGVVIAATGYELMKPEKLQEYGYTKDPDVVDGLEFERLLSASGPTAGEVRRPSDGKPVKNVVFIQCAGSRDPKHGVSYCSRICCMYTAKHALLFKHKVHDGHATVFYIDIRAAGKNYEEFVQRVMEEERVLYVRGKASRVVRTNGHLTVYGSDTLSETPVRIEADMVVLASAMVPGTSDVAGKLRIATDAYGFYQEAHPKLRPVETLTAGVFVTGAAHAPKDIPDTVAQASAAAAKALELLTQETLAREPLTARVDTARCMACFECVRVCPYLAAEKREIKDRQGNVVKMVAHINPAMCEGCGACVAGCRAGAMDLAGFTDMQMFAQLGALLEEREPAC